MFFTGVCNHVMSRYIWLSFVLVPMFFVFPSDEAVSADSDDESLSSSSESSSSSSLSSSSSSEDEEEEEEGERAGESEGLDTMDESTMDSMALDSEKENERYQSQIYKRISVTYRWLLARSVTPES